jgi:predicted phage tail protein
VVSVPQTPGPFNITSYTNIRVNGRAIGGSDGGSPILEWQLAWGTKPNNADFVGDLNSDGTGFVTGLTPGVTYYFWNRRRNAEGWSDLSARTSVRMRNVPDAPKAPIFQNKTQDSIKAIVVPNYDGGAAITNYKLVYGLSPTNSDNLLVNGTSTTFFLPNLEPGKTYYFWGRTTNIYGDSPWSARSQATLIAGAMVKVGFTWKRAVPYVKVNGVWVMARTWTKVAGVWKETAD